MVGVGDLGKVIEGVGLVLRMGKFLAYTLFMHKLENFS